MNEQLKSNLTSSKHWLRLVYMLLFAFFLQISSVLMWALVVVQFLFALITGNDNVTLRRFGDSLSQYIHCSLLFLSYNSEEKPFPFSDWPEPRANDEASVDTTAVNEAEEPDTDGQTVEANDEEPVVEAEVVEADSDISESTDSETDVDGSTKGADQESVSVDDSDVKENS